MAKRVVERLQSFFLQIDVAEIVLHKADQPNTKGFTAEEIARGLIGDGQRVTVLFVAQQELTFVVGAPQLVGLLPQRQGLR